MKRYLVDRLGGATAPWPAGQHGGPDPPSPPDLGGRIYQSNDPISSEDFLQRQRSILCLHSFAYMDSPQPISTELVTDDNWQIGDCFLLRWKSHKKRNCVFYVGDWTRGNHAVMKVVPCSGKGKGNMAEKVFSFKLSLEYEDYLII